MTPQTRRLTWNVRRLPPQQWWRVLRGRTRPRDPRWLLAAASIAVLLGARQGRLRQQHGPSGTHPQPVRVTHPSVEDLADLDDQESDATDVGVKGVRWTFALLVFVVTSMVILALWQGLIHAIPDGAPIDCLKNATFVHGGSAGCETVLGGLIRSVKEQRQKGPALQRSAPAAEWAFIEPGWPRLYVWTDNFFVAAYTLLFSAVVWRSRARFGEVAGKAKQVLYIGLATTGVLFLLGALCDYVENFWLLANIGAADIGKELSIVAGLSVWKIRLFLFNALLSGTWAAVSWSRVRSAPPN
jgi:hypothetical protein